MIMENGRVRSWYKWVEENRQPAKNSYEDQGKAKDLESSTIFRNSFNSSMIYLSDDRR